METQISLGDLYEMMKGMRLEIQKIKEKIDSNEDLFLADENLLAECWNSEEDEKAFAYLQ